MSSSRPSLHFPQEDRPFLTAHLPPSTTLSSSSSSTSSTAPISQSPYPFTTLTFATSLDSALSLSPNTPTPLSGPATKSLTHYLRSLHSAILIGVGTAIADNPSLNCRLEGVGGYGGEGLEGQPRPVIVDPQARWSVESSKLLELVKEGRGKAPWIVTATPIDDIPLERRQAVEDIGGKFITIPLFSSSSSSSKSAKKTLSWTTILSTLKANSIQSVMIEGGAGVINSLLQPEYFPVITSVIITIAPVWLGQGGTVVSPQRSEPEKAAVRLKEVQWKQFGEDVVMCGKIKLAT